jgi:tetratricopeptide (TPR) repeat protein
MSGGLKPQLNMLQEGARRYFSQWRPWQRTILGFCVVLLLALCLLLVLEVVLRTFGYGDPTTFFLKDPKTGMMVENEHFTWQFHSKKSLLKPHPFRFLPAKKKGTMRLFVLGDAAALGTPEPAFGFSRVLDRMLHHRYPDRTFEVINLAMRGIHSHVLRLIALECTRYDPDLVILYAGNNEWEGWDGMGSDWAGEQVVWRMRLQQALHAFKAGQLIASMFSPGGEAQAFSPDMNFFRKHRLHPDDPRRKKILDRFRQNLRDMFQHFAFAGIPVITAPVLVNEKDCPPLGSLHPEGFPESSRLAFDRWVTEGVHARVQGLLLPALESFKKAMAIDARYAELHFRMARLYEAMQDLPSARLHYASARDYDALPVRATGPVNAVLLELARDYEDLGMTVVHLGIHAREGSGKPDWVPGREWFYEHVDFRFNGAYMVASYFYPYLQEMLDLPRGSGKEESGRLLSLPECARQLGYNPVLEGMMNQAMIRLQQRAPFLDQLDHSTRMEALEAAFRVQYAGLENAHLEEAFRQIQEAMLSFPRDWHLPLLAARLISLLQDPDQAAGFAEKARDLMPHATRVRLALVEYLWRAGRYDHAELEWRSVVERYPHYAVAHPLPERP